MVTTVICTLLVAGCKVSNGLATQSLGKDNENATKWSNLTQNRPQIAKEFDTVGEGHNKMLAEVYNELVSFKDTQARAVSDKNGLSDEEISFVINRYFSGIKARTAVTENSEDSESAPEFEFSPAAQKFIDRIKVLIDPITEGTSQNEVEAIIKQIESIEQEAETVVLSEEKEPFYAYTATSRASLAYWHDNIKNWDNLRENNAQAERYISLFQKIAGSIASDAGGAAAGWAKGGELAEQLFPGNQNVKLAAQIICSAAVAGVSSAEGWRQGTYVIVMPIEWLIGKIKNI